MSTTLSIVCLAVPSLALQCELAERSGLHDAPVVLSDQARSRVEDLTSEARRRGVRQGMSLNDAIALCPGLDIIEPRPAFTAHHAERLIAAMEAVSPLVEEAAAGIVFADLRGMEAIYPHPGEVQRAIFAGTPSRMRPQIGIAARRFTAYAAARRAQPGSMQYIEPGHDAAFLADAPVDWLDLGIEVIEQMRLLGIRTCGDLASLPRHVVEAQFGPAGGRAWQAARGEDPTPLRPRPPERERVVEQIQAEPPLISREAALHGFDQLLGRALRQPRAAHRFVRLVRLRAETERGGLWEREQVLREPLGDRARLWTAIRTIVEYTEFPGPLSRLELELGGLTAESGRQASLLDAERTRRREQLDEMVRHLKVRFGESPVARVTPLEPWHRLPERRYALLDYDP